MRECRCACTNVVFEGTRLDEVILHLGMRAGVGDDRDERVRRGSEHSDYKEF